MTKAGKAVDFVRRNDTKIDVPLRQRSSRQIHPRCTTIAKIP